MIQMVRGTKDVDPRLRMKASVIYSIYSVINAVLLSISQVKSYGKGTSGTLIT